MIDHLTMSAEEAARLVIRPQESISISDIRRDLFAAFAMAGFLSQRVDEERADPPFRFIAEASYRMADAMVRAGTASNAE